MFVIFALIVGAVALAYGIIQRRRADRAAFLLNITRKICL